MCRFHIKFLGMFNRERLECQKFPKLGKNLLVDELVDIFIIIKIFNKYNLKSIY